MSHSCLKSQLIRPPLGHLLARVGDRDRSRLVRQAAEEHIDGKLWVQTGCTTE